MEDGAGPAVIRRWESGRPRGEPHVEIACDESGFAGGNLVGGHAPVLAHASVRIDAATAAQVMADLRRWMDGGPPGELKASALLRHRDLVTELWKPLAGAVRVHLVDTVFFALARLADLLGGGPAPRGTDIPGRDRSAVRSALVLYSLGPAAYGPERWRWFLTAASDLMRTNSRWTPPEPVAPFGVMVDEMITDLDRRVRAAAGAGARVPGPDAPDPDAPDPDAPDLGAPGDTTPRPAALADMVDILRGMRERLPAAAAVRATLKAEPKRATLLEPVVPALGRAVAMWTAGGGTVSVVHDDQSAVTPERIAAIAEHSGLVEVTLVDSRTDPRVQVADLIAGVARRVAGDLLAGRDPGDDLVALLRPAIDPGSVWADPVSWAVLVPQTAAR